MPFLSDSDTAALRAWIIGRLEDISDTDSDVLADYVIALVSTEETEEVAKPNAVESLQDFLQEKSEGFVDEVYACIRLGKYEIGWVPDLKAAAPATVSVGNGVNGVGTAANEGMGVGAGSKRSFQEDAMQDVETASGQLPGFGNTNDRPMKQARRGRGGGSDWRGGRGGFQGQQHPTTQTQYGGFAQGQQMAQMGQMPRMPTPPPGMQAFDMNNPAAVMATLQAMGMQMPPQGPNGPPFQNGNGNGFSAPRKTGKRCNDYDRKGFCTYGATCKFDHDDTPLNANGGTEYDPTNPEVSFFNAPQPNNRGSFDMSGTNSRSERGQRGGMRGRGRGGRGGRFEFSSTGYNTDRSNTSIVVEQIPEDKFSEDSIREFFSQFGAIEEVTLQAYKNLAILKFSNYDEAQAAYKSPKVVFDNRFVKVYWYKSPDHLPKPPNGAANGEDTEMAAPPEPAFDPEEVARKQSEAQAKHEAQTAARSAAAKQKEELDNKIKAMNAERAKMAAMLSKKSGSKASPAPANGASTPKPTEEKASTRALREKLAALEQEASSIGVDPDSVYGDGTNSNQTSGFQYQSEFAPRGRGRGRGGRGMGRGRGTPDYGRGGFMARGGAVKRLDNRPKSLSVLFVEEGKGFDNSAEALRQFVFLGDGLDEGAVVAHPERSDAAVVVYEARYLAERFMQALVAGKGGVLDGVGKVECGWYTGPAVSVPAGDASGKMEIEGHGNGNGIGGMELEETEVKQTYGEDVAEDNDQCKSKKHKVEDDDLDIAE